MVSCINDFSLTDFTIWIYIYCGYFCFANLYGQMSVNFLYKNRFAMDIKIDLRKEFDVTWLESCCHFIHPLIGGDITLGLIDFIIQPFIEFLIVVAYIAMYHSWRLTGTTMFFKQLKVGKKFHFRILLDVVDRMEWTAGCSGFGDTYLMLEWDGTKKIPCQDSTHYEKCFHYPWNKVLPIGNFAKWFSIFTSKGKKPFLLYFNILFSGEIRITCCPTLIFQMRT